MDTETSLYVGNLDAQVDDALLYELFLQLAPVSSVRLPRDRVSGTHQGFAFVRFPSSADAEYVLKVADGIVLYGRSLRVDRERNGRRH
ncbi:uncharacterized protein C5L36_0B12380 [Pichia kudriavzevii]|uniref:RRM domain-containing protein n=1 Tax=Pichia kudriavzevii TaxID=4909 RepID=A0A2U9R3U4_PICKU|nr:uncharacterized protein C5L36_0B12380 [Pichia kudriavzevii]AWU76010.1 hypothetical protein C5L36_0B12380 [Pichia kudriavzevii]